ncbi:MAG: hypothetical protein IPG07_01580 [Crocinitomicaceae bacterium]|nr:hypothetical protein [Crocinitomicaceae bacterium]
MKNIVVLILAILCGVVVSAQVNIVSALELHKSIYGAHNYSDLTANTAFTDLKNGYYESRFVTDPANSDWDILLTQARLYLNKDRTYLLAVTYFDSDEQCSRYKTSFYEVSKNGDTLLQLQNENILPQLTWDDFLSKSKSKTVLEKYLPQIKQEYLGEDATIEDALNEVYDFHFKLIKNQKILQQH